MPENPQCAPHTNSATGGLDSLAKQGALFGRLGSLESVLIAFSAGTDSAYLAWAASRVLGDRAFAVTAVSPSFSAHDREHAEKFVREISLNHEFIESREFENPLYVANDANRCYHCKKELFEKLSKLRSDRGLAAVAYGVNADDLRDFRPGHRAASEHNVLAPLLEANLTKSEIRQLSRDAGLSTWDRPASPCLASRVPYGTRVTAENLSRIENAESALREFGFRQFRVRFHGDLARIEIDPRELPRALEPAAASKIKEAVQGAGFAEVALDPQGYRQGSLNSALRTR
jgi:pyridinium-3,5-biscarboxylic acid mononucleotide sulfurtransferase